jgi:hypothetical protein
VRPDTTSAPRLNSSNSLEDLLGDVVEDAS